MFCFATAGSSSPHFERRGLHLASHQRDHLPRSQSKLTSNRVETCPIFPGHLDDPIDIILGQRSI
jgi:hypothetical protein